MGVIGDQMFPNLLEDGGESPRKDTKVGGITSGVSCNGGRHLGNEVDAMREHCFNGGVVQDGRVELVTLLAMLPFDGFLAGLSGRDPWEGNKIFAHGGVEGGKEKGSSRKGKEKSNLLMALIRMPKVTNFGSIGGIVSFRVTLLNC